MDTRFWGPSGWKLLHMISFTYQYSPESSVLYSKFLETIPFILPCKYCRSSLIDYYKEHPFQISTGKYTNQNERAFLNGTGVMNPMLDLTKWMFTIHNCVNNKLRTQGLYSAPNPTFSEVKTKYTALCKEPWNVQLAQLWDFLFAVGYNHPRDTHHDSIPMPDCPPGIRRSKDKCERNKWNVLSLKHKIVWYNRFWTFLPAVLPSEIAIRWQEAIAQYPVTLQSRQSTLAWLWRIRCMLDTDFKDPYTSICKKVASYSSDCGASKNGITCRKGHSRKGHSHTQHSRSKRSKTRKTISHRK